MVSYKPTLPNSQEEQDKAYNPREQAYREGMGAGYVNSGLDQAEAFANDPENASDNLREQEEAGDTPAGGFYRPSPQKNKPKVTLKGFFKKGGPAIGAGGAIGTLAVVLIAIFAPSSMLVNLAENIGITNDSSATAMQRRFFSVFTNAAGDSDPICTNTSKNIKCKMGRISNTALQQLERKGVTALYADDTTNRHTDTRKGYPTKNPTRYSISNGTANPTIVNAADLPGYLAANPGDASKILGTRGAFNLKVKAWAGKHISNRLYKKFNITRNGGLADGQNRPDNNTNRARQTLEKLRGRIQDISGLSSKVGETQLRDKVTGDLNKAKKGGVGYMVAVGTCIGVRAPGYIAAAVAAVQLAQIITIAHDTILSPASKLKSTAIDSPEEAMTQDDMSAIGAFLTDRVPDENGDLKSALDSAILLSAMGVNKGKPEIPTKYAPGYSILTNSAIQVAGDAANISDGACNAVMSPAAMWTAFAVNSAITVAASSTVILGAAKVAVDIVVSEIISAASGELIGAFGPQILEEIATNDAVSKAEGIEAGHVLGTSILGLYPAAGMARSLPGLKESQLSDYAAVQAEVIDMERQMDIATLSPFDISSRYTFLGSIVNNARFAYLANGASLAPTSIISNIASTITGSSIASAASQNMSNCSYAAEYDLATDNPEDTPAINAAGLPCTGITTEQAQMSSEEAVDLLAEEGWINIDADIPDNATIDDLLEEENPTGLSLDNNAFIRIGNPLHDFITTCSDASTGSYLTNAAGCTTNSQTGVVTDICNSGSVDCTNEDGDQITSPDQGTGVGDGRALIAMSVFLLDFQVLQSMNGEDEDTAGTENSAADVSFDMGALYEDSTNIACAAGTADAGTDTAYHNGQPFQIRLCSLPNTDEPNREGGMGLVNSRVSGAVYAMLEEMRTATNLQKIPLGDSFRTMAGQEEAKRIYGSQAATPGYSNHQSGLALDFEYLNNHCVHSMSANSTCEASPIWTWLNENASKFNYKQLTTEWWHWSPTGL